MFPSVCVTIVTHNSLRYIDRCLKAVLAQDYAPIEVVVVDNASNDGSSEALARYEYAARVIRNPVNTGFASGQNQAIGESDSDWALTLNPDALLKPGFIRRLVTAARLDPNVGVVCGKLLRAAPDLSLPMDRRVDSAGIHFTPNLRHFDRGWNEPDDGRFGEVEYVFGASAAAALYRREMIRDVSLEDGFFDPDFFAYREDADVAWRAQLLGWRCLYVPEAVAYHVRRVVPEKRWRTPAALRMHAVKNRFLMRLKNMTPDLYRRQWLPVLLRDLVVVGGCFLMEPGSLPAFWHVARRSRRALAKRRQIMSRRIVTDDYLASWFREQPVSRPLEALRPGRGERLLPA
ncbi:MAG: glycosyltransferase family 2 protein [Bryobacteraceae bacterium]|nr:glycosyltransferase family 2 protein [Bryobacteraceae bacterium]